jgi:hypothetical protein
MTKEKARMLSKNDNSVNTNRIGEIDLLRGLLLILMTLEHGSILTRMMGRTGFSPPSIVQFIPATTTSMFFFISGFMYAYTKISGISLKNIKVILINYTQVWRIYCANAATFLIITLIIQYADKELLTASRFSDFTERPLTTIGAFAALLSAPFGLDVLQVYILAFIFAPLYLIVIKISKIFAVALTVSAWLYAQIKFVLNPDAYTEIFFIDITAWQITFAGGMLFGSMKHAKEFIICIQQSKSALYICATMLVTISPLWIAQRFIDRSTYDALKFTLPGVERITLGPLRIACCASLLIIFLIVLKRYTRPESWLSISISFVGRNTLACFCASNVLIYIVALIWQETHSNSMFWFTEILLVPAIIFWATISRFFNKRKSNA